MNLGSFEIIVIVVLALLLYGRRLPEITRAVGKGYKSFKKEVDGVKEELNKIATFDVDTKTKAPAEREPLQDKPRPDTLGDASPSTDSYSDSGSAVPDENRSKPQDNPVG